MAETTKPKLTHTKPLQARVKPAQYAMFEKAADKDGRSLSSWIRDRLTRAATQELGKDGR